MHVLFTTPPAPGHVYPTLPLVEELVDRDHRVTYISAASLEAEIVRAGALFIDLGWEPDTTTLAASGFSVDALSADLRGFLAAARTLAPGLLDALSDDPPDVVCIDSVPLGGFLAEQFAASTVSLIANLATNEAFPPSNLIDGFMPHHPAMQHYFAELADWFSAHGLEVPFGPSRDNAPEPPSLVFIPREFQIAGNSFAENVHFIGPSMPRRARRSASWTPPHDDAQVLLVSLGTAFNNRPEFFASCAEAFADSRFHVVLSLGTHIDPADIGKLPHNIEAHQTVPQLDVLRHATAFITHAGMGSTMEALYYEVPAIAVPQVREQSVNAARLESLGLGVQLPSPTPGDLRTMTEKVAADTVIRSGLAQMREAINRAGGTTAGTGIIEAAGTNRRDPA